MRRAAEKQKMCLKVSVLFYNVSSTLIGFSRLPRGCCLLGRHTSNVGYGSSLVSRLFPSGVVLHGFGTCVLENQLVILDPVAREVELWVAQRVCHFWKSSAVVQNQVSVCRRFSYLRMRVVNIICAYFGVDNFLPRSRCSLLFTGLQCSFSESACIHD